MPIINTRRVYPLKYNGSIFWLIFFLIFHMPLAFFLLLMNARFVKDNSIFYLCCRGSWGWIIFWAILFFPIAMLVMLFCGVDVVEEKEC
jgi:hypothetical protein